MNYIRLAEVIPYGCPLDKDNCIGCQYFDYVKIWPDEAEVHCECEKSLEPIKLW